MIKDLIYLIFIIFIPVPTSPFVILFFQDKNPLYAICIYTFSILLIYLIIFYLCYRFNFKHKYVEFPSFFSRKYRKLKMPLINDLIKGDISKIIAVSNIIQLPIGLHALLMGFYQKKIKTVIYYCLYVSIINSLIYICISSISNSFLGFIPLPENYDIENIIFYILVSLSIIYILYTQWDLIKKIIKSFFKS